MAGPNYYRQGGHSKPIDQQLDRSKLGKPTHGIGSAALSGTQKITFEDGSTIDVTHEHAAAIRKQAAGLRSQSGGVSDH